MAAVASGAANGPGQRRAGERSGGGVRAASERRGGGGGAVTEEAVRAGAIRRRWWRAHNELFLFYQEDKFPLTSDSKKISRYQTGYIVGDLIHVDLRTRAYNARPMSSPM